jgi:uncharacterized protein (DUF1697 family)
MTTYVILLRGVMPTGKNKVPMAPLRSALTEAGLASVQTYIQSGNVIADTDLGQAELEQLIHDAIQARFGGDIAVLARTARRFTNILQRNPYADSDSSKTYFTLLAREPDKAALKDLLATEFSPEQIHYMNNTLYTLYATKYSDSKFNNNYFERKLKVAATTRNFNTMTRLTAIATNR